MCNLESGVDKRGIVAHVMANVKLVVVMASGNYGKPHGNRYDTADELKLVEGKRKELFVIQMPGVSEVVPVLKKYTVVHWPSESAARNGLYEEIYRQLDAADLQGEMQLDWSQFRLGNHKVGSGSFGMVFKSACGDGKYVAFKQIVGGDHFSLKDVEMAEKEMGTMASLRHRNIIGILWSNVKLSAKDCEGNYIGIGFAMKLAERGNLREFIDSKDDAWAIAERVNFFLDVAAGLCYLHTRPSPVLHRDLKSANVLVCTHHDGSLVGKLCDFGMSKTADASMKTQNTFAGGTLRWAAPEFYQCLEERFEFQPSTDVYSLAMVGYELMTRSIPFANIDDRRLSMFLARGERVKDLRDKAPRNCPEEILELVESMWNLNVEERPSARHAVSELLCIC
jgi:serine/threonine protein kinase